MQLDENVWVASAEGAHILELGMRLKRSGLFQYDGGEMLVLRDWKISQEAQKLPIDADVAMSHAREGDGVLANTDAPRLAAKLARTILKLIGDLAIDERCLIEVLENPSVGPNHAPVA
jgi:hypothetical protein